MRSRSVKMNDRRLNRFTAQLFPDLLLVISRYDICTLTSIKWTGKVFKEYLYLVSGVWERLQYWVFTHWSPKKLPKHFECFNRFVIHGEDQKNRGVCGREGNKPLNRFRSVFVNFKTIGMCFIYISGFILSSDIIHCLIYLWAGILESELEADSSLNQY